MARDSYRSLRDLNLERTFVVKNPENRIQRPCTQWYLRMYYFSNTNYIKIFINVQVIYNPVETNSSIVRKEDPDTVVVNIYIKVLPTSNYLII